MSIEQILLLVIFVIIPLVQSLWSRVRRRPGDAQPEPEFDSEGLVLDGDEPRAPRDEPARAPPTPQPQPPTPAAAPALILARAVPPARPAPVRRMASAARPALAPPLGTRQRSQDRRLRQLFPRDVRDLRRAIWLADVLGPPRSLDRSDPLRR